MNRMIGQEFWRLARATGPFAQIAGISGALAVSLGAYNAHRNYAPEDEKLKQVFSTASQYHFIHTLALFGLPLCRKPYIACFFMVSGTILFCGTSYYYAISGNSKFNKLNPIGGSCFILGWLAMLL